MTLNLKRILPGVYKVENDTHIIRVEKKLNGSWFGVVEIKTHKSKDLLGNIVQMTNEIFKWSAPTKREIVDTLSGWVVREL